MFCLHVMLFYNRIMFVQGFKFWPKIDCESQKFYFILFERYCILDTVMTVYLEKYRLWVFCWLAFNFFDRFQSFVFVQVESINRRGVVAKIINGSAYVNCRSTIAALPNESKLFLQNFFKPAKIRQFWSIFHLWVPRFQFGKRFRESTRRAATSLRFQVRRGCDTKFFWNIQNLQKQFQTYKGWSGSAVQPVGESVSAFWCLAL